MARKSRPVDPTAGPLQEFAHDLRALREKAGNPTYRSLAQKAGFGATTLGEAAGGVRIPSLDVTLAYVGACSGDTVAWEERWRQVNQLLSGPAVEDQAPDEPGTQPAAAMFPSDPEPPGRGPRRSPWVWLRTSWPARVTLGTVLLIVAGAAVLLSGVGSNPVSSSAAPRSTVNVDQTCPAFGKPGAFNGETYLGQTAVRTAPSTAAHLVKNVPAGCWLQFTGYCLGAVVLDRNDVGQALPDERWFEIEGGDLMSSAVVHGNPPSTMKPNSCPGSIPGPSSISLGIVADPDMPGWAILSAHGTGVHITGYAAYFAPVDAPGTAPEWHEVGAPTTAPAADGFDVPWRFGLAGEAPSTTPTLVVAAACLAGDAPAGVTNAVQVVPTNPSTAKPVVLSTTMLTHAAAAACAIP
jgi:hypothetical protein